MKVITKRVSLCALGLLIRCYVEGQSLPLATDSIYSSALKEVRGIKVLFPEMYQPGGTVHYDVSYVLDGENNSDLVQQAAVFLCREKLAKPTLVVSIPNRGNLRDRDFTPTHDPKWPLSGGASSFLLFLQQELMPYINSTYPTSGRNLIFGQSFSGLFGMYAFLKAPGLFQTYVLADPSLWWDNDWLIALGEKELSTMTCYLVGELGRALRRKYLYSIS